MCFPSSHGVDRGEGDSVWSHHLLHVGDKCQPFAAHHELVLIRAGLYQLSDHGRVVARNELIQASREVIAVLKKKHKYEDNIQ